VSDNHAAVQAQQDEAVPWMLFVKVCRENVTGNASRLLKVHVRHQHAVELPELSGDLWW
jgi:hypothetical protein